MRLALSSAAAPDATLSELVEACGRRGLADLELVEGHGHGLGPGASVEAVEEALRTVRDGGVELTGFRFEDDGAAGAGKQGAAVEGFLRALGAPGVLPSRPGSRLRPELDGESRGAPLLRATPLHRPDALEELDPGDPSGLVWEVGAGGEMLPPGAVSRVLERFGSRIRQLRLYGGGPEAATQEGVGIGALMGRLTLARFRGPVVLTPSTPRYSVAWAGWLGRRGGWGCGGHSRAEPGGRTELDRELVQLGSAAGGGR